ncbi:pheromone [Schizophyllum commune]
MDSFDTLLTSFVDGSLDGETAIEHLILAAARESASDASPSYGGSSSSHAFPSSGTSPTSGAHDGSPLPVNADTIEDYGSYCTVA